MKLKENMAETAALFEAWWQRQPMARPLVSVGTRERRSGASGLPGPKTLDERWLDVRGVVDRSMAWVEERYYPGASLPIVWANLGPVITAVLFGGDLKFDEHTSWCDPIFDHVGCWEKFCQTPPDFSNRYWRVLEEMTAYAVERASERASDVLVGMTDLHGNYDILAALRGSEALCMDMLDEPELVAKAAMHAAKGYNEAFARQWGQVARRGVSTCWTPMMHRGRAYVPSCDFWCMVSPDMGRELVLPSIEKEMELLDRSIFHLDGVQALGHLDTLLAMPRLDAVQWVYGAGQGPAMRWIDVYRRILAAGKSVQVLAESHQDALGVMRAIGHQNVWYCVWSEFATAAEAESFVAEMGRAG